jgi:VWFA-related protein
MGKLRFTLVVAGLTLAIPAPPAAAQLNVGAEIGERVDVNIVNVDVYATDKDGNPVPGLGRGDFEIREDGKAMEVVNFDAFSGAPQAAASPAPGSPAAGAPATAGAPDEGQSLVVFIDNTFLIPAHRNRVLGQLRSILDQLPPKERVMLMTEDPGLHVRLPFTTDRAALAKALDAVEALSAAGVEDFVARRDATRQIFSIRDVGLADPDPNPCPLDIVNPVKAYAQTVHGDVLRTIKILTVAVSSLSGVPGRKALFLVSDGMPVTPGEELFQVLAEMCSGGGIAAGIPDTYDVAERPDSYTARQAALDAQRYSTVKDLAALAAHANAHQVTLYTLQASGLQGAAAASAEFEVDERILQMTAVTSVQIANYQGALLTLAADTGGRATLNSNDIRQDMGRIREDFATYYSLGFSPPHQGDGRAHAIEVRVKRPGVRLRYRKSYRDKPALERTVDRTLAVLFYGDEDNPLDVQMEIGEQAPAAAGTWTVPVRLRIPLHKLALQQGGESFDGKLRLLVATHGAAGGGSPVRQVEIPIRIPRMQALTALGQSYLYEVKLTLQPGAQRIAVAVRDEATASTSYLARSVQVGAAESTAVIHRPTEKP